MPQAFLFIGRSGSGKGTQADLLIKYLENKNKIPNLYLETGKKFRGFIDGEGYINSLSRKVYENDGLQPDFLACYLWTDQILDDLKGGENLILDGAARTLTEAKVLDSAISFLGYEKLIVIHLDVSRQWSYKHLEKRGRDDDSSKERIEKRLNWFETDVVPAIEHYSSSSMHEYLEINGEQSIEEVHQDIVESIEKIAK